VDSHLGIAHLTDELDPATFRCGAPVRSLMPPLPMRRTSSSMFAPSCTSTFTFAWSMSSAISMSPGSIFREQQVEHDAAV
jgi:hypothetical protein